MIQLSSKSVCAQLHIKCRRSSFYFNKWKLLNGSIIILSQKYFHSDYDEDKSYALLLLSQDTGIKSLLQE